MHLTNQVYSNNNPVWLSSAGYGHISPATNTGRAITIIYAIIGIPIFLILLADFGKLFTRGIKFVWAYVRRLYYTGSLRRVRKQQQVRVSDTQLLFEPSSLKLFNQSKSERRKDKDRR